MLKKVLLMTLLAASLAVSSMALIGCNTVHGVGKDTEHAGDAIQDAADRNR